VIDVWSQSPLGVWWLDEYSGSGMVKKWEGFFKNIYKLKGPMSAEKGITMTMHKLKAGDIVEIIVPESHRLSNWNGFRFKVTEIKFPLTAEGIVVSTLPGKHYLVGDAITWNYPENLSLVSDDTTTEQPETEKYFSPFSGEWT